HRHRVRVSCGAVVRRIPVKLAVHKTITAAISPACRITSSRFPAQPVLTRGSWEMCRQHLAQSYVRSGKPRSPSDREHEVGDAVALDADRRVPEQDILRRELA